jgi:hypothetical protein
MSLPQMGQMGSFILILPSWFVKAIIFATVATSHIIQGKTTLMVASGATGRITPIGLNPRNIDQGNFSPFIYPFIFLFFFITLIFILARSRPVGVCVAMGNISRKVWIRQITFRALHSKFSFPFVSPLYTIDFWLSRFFIKD